MTDAIVASARARSAARSGVSASSIPVRYSAMVTDATASSSSSRADLSSVPRS
jgi:hypothetical protein